MATTIFCFTGTGNSFSIANTITQHIESTLHLISRESLETKQVVSSECLGFVFPVYAWGVPKEVLHLIRNLEFAVKPKYTFGIAVCGDYMGETLFMLKKALAEKGAPLNYSAGLVMPNNYLPLSDVDDEKIATEKIEKAGVHLQSIIKKLVDKQENEPEKTSFLGKFYTRVIHPAFTQYIKKTDKHFVVDDGCTECGNCVLACPSNNITLEKGIPVWHGECYSCFACINACPVHVIQYGKSTRKRSRYFNPDVHVRTLHAKRVESVKNSVAD